MTAKQQIPLVDQWKPTEYDIYFTNAKDIIIAPMASYYHIDDNNSRINYFWIKPKKSYNSDLLRDHCCLYLNYFERYFDDENTEVIYRTMIFHLHMMDEYYVEKILYGNNVYDDNYEVGCRSIEDHKRIYSVMQQNKNAFMKLFSLFYYDLWD